MDKLWELWLAPMEGVMSVELVRAVAGLNILCGGALLTPFYRVTANRPKARRLNEFFTRFCVPGAPPPVVQLMATSPRDAAEAAKIFAELGAAGIDLNFGCPSSQVLSSGAGGAMLRNPKNCEELVLAVKESVPQLPLSVKLRAGWSAPGETAGLIGMLSATGALRRIFFHCRTVAEKYRFLENQERFRRFAAALEAAKDVPLVLNGDINSEAGIAQLAGLFPNAAGVMCGRGLLRDPGMFLRFRGATGAPEQSRAQAELFAAACRDGLMREKAIELSNFIWGGRDQNPHFKTLVAMPPRSSYFL